MKFYCIIPATKDKEGVCVLPTMQEPEILNLEQRLLLSTIEQIRYEDSHKLFRKHIKVDLPKFPTSCDRVAHFDGILKYQYKRGSEWIDCSEEIYEYLLAKFHDDSSLRKFIVPQSEEKRRPVYTDTEFPGYKIDMGGVKESLGSLLKFEEPLLTKCLESVGYWACHLVKKTLESKEKDVPSVPDGEVWSVRVQLTQSHGKKDLVLDFDHKPTECEIEQDVDHWAKQMGLGQRNGYSAKWGDPVKTSEKDALPSLNRKSDQGTEAGKQNPVEQKDEPKRKGKRITLCGSTKFKREFDAINKQLTLEGNVVYSVCAFGHADKIEWTKEQKELLDEVHKRKIDNSDAIFVIDVDGYIGNSTHSEIEYAAYHNKTIRYLSDFPDLKMICDYATLSLPPKVEPQPKTYTESEVREAFSEGYEAAMHHEEFSKAWKEFKKDLH
jgi:hypothetical protein